MKKIALLLALLLSLSWSALAESEFVFDGMLGWDSTQEEALEYLGEGVVRSSVDDGNMGKLEILIKSGGSYAGFDCERMVVAYANGSLLRICCYYPQEEIDHQDALTAFLTENYGEPQLKSYSLLEYIMHTTESETESDNQLETWTLEDAAQTQITLSRGLTPDGEVKFPSAYEISFLNQSLQSQIQAP